MYGAERVRRWHGQGRLLFSVSRLTFRPKITGVQWPVLSQRPVTTNSVLSHFLAIFLIFHFLHQFQEFIAARAVKLALWVEARRGLQLR